MARLTGKWIQRSFRLSSGCMVQGKLQWILPVVDLISDWKAMISHWNIEAHLPSIILNMSSGCQSFSPTAFLCMVGIDASRVGMDPCPTNGSHRCQHQCVASLNSSQAQDYEDSEVQSVWWCQLRRIPRGRRRGGRSARGHPGGIRVGWILRFVRAC